MNIKDAERLSGVSKQNIRFYERQQLISPGRNEENDYREYTPEDIQILKQIRLFRMLDMPLEQIRMVLSGKLTLAQAVEAQRAQLEKERQELEKAIHYCEILAFEDLVSLDVDQLLMNLDASGKEPGFFAGWVEDYHRFTQYQRDRVFTFTPDGAVTSPGEFSLALCTFANENDLDLVITREGMYPEFTIGGIDYTAQRHYTRVGGLPVAIIRCEAKYPEDFAPDINPKRKRMMTMLWYGGIVAVLLLLYLSIFIRSGWTESLSLWEGIVIWVFLIILFAAGVVRSLFLFGNDRTKK